MSARQKDDYDWAYAPPISAPPQSPPLTPGSGQYMPSTFYPSHGPSLSLSVPQQQQQQYFPQMSTNSYAAARPGHFRSVSAYEMEGGYPQQQQQQGSYAQQSPRYEMEGGYVPQQTPVAYSASPYSPQQQMQSTNPFFGSSEMPVPQSAPPVMANNPFAEPPSPPKSDGDADSTGGEGEVDLPGDLDLTGKEKSADSYQVLDIYWDQNFSAVLCPAEDVGKNKKEKEKDRYERKKPSWFFESKPFSSSKAISNGGDVTLYACGRGDTFNTSASSPVETDGKRPKKERSTSAYDGKGTVVGCVRYHYANWKGHWKMHVCMGQPHLGSANYECMTQNGVVKDRQWTLEGYSFPYTSPEGESLTCRKFSVKGTKSTIPDEVEAYTKHGNLKMQDAETGTTVAVYLRNAVSMHKRGRMLLRRGLSSEFRDFAVLCLLGIDERRQRDFRNSTYCASGWWVHMAARGIAGDRMKKARE